MIRNEFKLAGFSFLLVFMLAALSSIAYAAGETAPGTPVAQQAQPDPKAKLAAEQKLVADAMIARDEAQKKRDVLAAQQASAPNPDTERKIKDADYEIMMAESKLSSATKSLERIQKKLDDSAPAEKALPVPVSVEKPISNVEKPISAEKPISNVEKPASAEVDQAKLKAAQEATKKAAEEKAHKEDEARKQEEARIAQQKAAEEQARKTAEAEAAAKKQALAAELGIDLSNCKALPTVPAKSAANLSDADLQQQAYAQGELRRINRLVSEKAIDDVPPVSPFPALEGSMLKPCDADQKQALKFGYMGSGQYRLETPVLSGEQNFYVKGVIEPVQRTIPDADNGETYVFFLDLKFPGRYKLIAYKKVLFDQLPE